MTEEEFYAHPSWQWCTFEGPEWHALLIGLKTAFREKLEWLEEAEIATLQLRTVREKRNAETTEGRGPSRSSLNPPFASCGDRA